MCLKSDLGKAFIEKRLEEIRNIWEMEKWQYSIVIHFFFFFLASLFYLEFIVHLTLPNVQLILEKHILLFALIFP